MQPGRTLKLLAGGLLLVCVCANEQENSRKLQWRKPEFENENDMFQNRNNTISLYLNQWNSSNADLNQWDSASLDQNQLEVSNDDASPIGTTEYFQEDIDNIADGVFEASSNNSAMILTDLSRCFTDYKLFTCMKLLLLSRINALLAVMEAKNTTGSDLNLLHGFVTLKWLNSDGSTVDLAPSGGSKLDNQLTRRVLKLFKSRSLQLALLPGFGLEITPRPKADEDGFVCFSAKTFIQPNFNKTAAVAEMRNKMGGGKKKKKGGFNFMPMMIVPQMIMLGMLPFALANLKMMVMNAFMINSMALNSAIFMTIRNLVFGPKKGPKIKYVNYGYNKGKKNKKPEIILHSPAAFVKKPPRHEELHIDSHIHHSEEGAGPYIRRTNNKRRKGELQKHTVRKDNVRLRTRLKDTPKEVQKMIAQISEPHGDLDYRPKPGDDLGDSIQSYYEPSSNEHTGVDAPSSYLNNNQFLLPGSNEQGVQDANVQLATQQYSDSFQAYNNIKLSKPLYETTAQGTADGSEHRNKFSSKYKQLATGYDNEHTNGNYYSNHRLS